MQPPVRQLHASSWQAAAATPLALSAPPGASSRHCRLNGRTVASAANSEVTDNNNSQADPEALPSVNAAIAALAIPALGTELVDPLLSACDTAFVGRLDAQQLAGVGIASSVFTYCFLFFNFLSTASAPLIAQSLARCAFTSWQRYSRASGHKSSLIQLITMTL